MGDSHPNPQVGTRLERAHVRQLKANALPKALRILVVPLEEVVQQAHGAHSLRKLTRTLERCRKRGHSIQRDLEAPLAVWKRLMNTWLRFGMTNTQVLRTQASELAINYL